MSARRWSRPVLGAGVALVLVVALAGLAYGRYGSPLDEETIGLTVWRHDGTDAENRAFAAQVRAFNRAAATRAETRSEPQVVVRARSIAEGDYNDTVQAAGAALELPDIVEVDGPNIASYAYQGMLTPLEDLIAPATVKDLIPSLRAQAQWRGHTWALGTYDSGLGIYASRSALEAAGVRIPNGVGDSWTAEEFSAVLAALAAKDPDGLVLDLKRSYGAGEWLTYGFAPLVASAGGSLLDPDTGQAAGSLDGPAALSALRTLASWAPYVDPDADDDAFVSGRDALSWVGHWTYSTYHDALGSDLVVLPLPDLGEGAKTGQGSWAWGISDSSPFPEAAAEFLEFMLSPDEVLRVSDANGAVPGTRMALERSDLYRTDGPLRLFAEQLVASCGDGPPDPSCVGVPRPQTPGYPTLSAEFARAVNAALTGGDPQAALHEAAILVDEDREASRDWR